MVNVDTRYVSRTFHRSDLPSRDWSAAAVIGDPATKRLAMALPAEGDRWVVAVAGINGETAPSEDTAMLEYVRGFDSPVIADVITASEPLSEPVIHRFPSNQRRHVEALRRFPLGWVLLGDAVCSYNPIYGQGMTSAAQQAAGARRRARPRRRGRTGPSLATYFRAVGRIVNGPWSIAVGGDFAYPDTEGKKPFATDLLNRYMDRLVKAGQCDDDVVIRFNEVISLVRSPQTLMSPAFALRVLRKARHADRLAARRLDPDADIAPPESAVVGSELLTRLITLRLGLSGSTRSDCAPGAGLLESARRESHVRVRDRCTGHAGPFVTADAPPAPQPRLVAVKPGPPDQGRPGPLGASISRDSVAPIRKPTGRSHHP